MTRIADALRIHAIANPDGIAIDAGQAGAVRWSEIAGRAEALAARLIASMDPARAVAVDMDHGIANCIADIALLEAGFSPVLLPPFFSPEIGRAHV